MAGSEAGACCGQRREGIACPAVPAPSPGARVFRGVLPPPAFRTGAAGEAPVRTELRRFAARLCRARGLCNHRARPRVTSSSRPFPPLSALTRSLMSPFRRAAPISGRRAIWKHPTSTSCQPGASPAGSERQRGRAGGQPVELTPHSNRSLPDNPACSSWSHRGWAVQEGV